MKVIVACEFSGIVRDAFRTHGHNAISCDVLPTERPGPHIQDDIRNVDLSQYDLLVAHPPCQHLAVSGARWFKEKRAEQEEALDFVRYLLDAPVPHIALENPVSVISSRIRKPDQIVHPWQFGHPETKATCWWLKGLPKLEPTCIVDGRKGRVWYEAPSPDRWKNRSRTYPGMAMAMAAQWGATATRAAAYGGGGSDWNVARAPRPHEGAGSNLPFPAGNSVLLDAPGALANTSNPGTPGSGSPGGWGAAVPAPSPQHLHGVGQ